MDYTKIQWWDRKSFIRSTGICTIIFIGLLWWIEHIKPPKEKPLERLPSISGIYKCCEAGGRYSASWVGSTQIACGPTKYWDFIGTPRNDCGLKELLNGKQVAIERIHIPAFGGDLAITKKISSNSTIYYEVSDEELHRRWLSGSHRSSFTISFIAFIAIYFFQLYRLKENK